MTGAVVLAGCGARLTKYGRGSRRRGLDAGAVLAIAALWFGAIADGVLLSNVARRYHRSLWGARPMALRAVGSLRLDAAGIQRRRKAP